MTSSRALGEMAVPPSSELSLRSSSHSSRHCPFLSGTDGPAQTLLLCLACGSGILPAVKAERQRGFLLRGWEKHQNVCLRISSELESLLSHPLCPLKIHTHTQTHTQFSLYLFHPTQVHQNIHSKLLIPAGPMNLIFSCRLRILNLSLSPLQNLQMVSNFTLWVGKNIDNLKMKMKMPSIRKDTCKMISEWNQICSIIR